MKRILTIAVSAAIWAGIIFYLVWSSRLGDVRRSEVTAARLDVRISNSAEADIIRPPMVETWIREAGLWPTERPIDLIDTRAISDVIRTRDFVRDVRTYVDLTGAVNVDVAQRVPAMRFINDAGYDFYVTSDACVVPVAGHSAHYVPVVTGTFALPFDRKFSGALEDIVGEAEKKEGRGAETEKKSDKNYIFLSKLINFVEYIGDDDFWSSQIVQINVTAPPARSSRLAYEPEIELIPRVGDHVVILGALDGYRAKLEKLMTFYRHALSREGWGRWSYINLKYEGQVVCR